MVPKGNVPEVAKANMQVMPCKARNDRGEPCSSPRMEGSEYCFFHNPAVAEKRAAARKQGGINRRQGKATKPVGSVQAQTPEDVLTLVEQALADCLTLENSITRNRAIGYLASIALKTQEVGELDRRLVALEAQAKLHSA